MPDPAVIILRDRFTTIYTCIFIKTECRLVCTLTDACDWLVVNVLPLSVDNTEAVTLG